MEESIEALEQKLKIAKQIKEIEKLFSEAKCPVCGNQTIEPNIFVRTDEAMSYGYAEVKCKKCGMFNCRRDISGHGAYHWNYDGSSKLAVLEELKTATIGYLK